MWNCCLWSVSIINVCVPMQDCAPMTISCLLLAVLLTGVASQEQPRLRTEPVLAATSADPVHAALVENRVIPEVLDDFEPSVQIAMAFAGKQYAIGSQIVPADAKAEPALTFTGLKPNTLYTLVMTDPGVLTTGPVHNSAWQWLHWIKVNMEPGDVVMSYSGPNPPQGNHRYVILLFEQTKGAVHPTSPQNRDADRANFDTRAFAATNGLKPVGATFFLSQH